MRRMFAVLLIALLLCAAFPAFAENIATQINAPQTFQATYTNATGNTIITIDADVIVPDVQTAYLIPVQKAFPTEDDLDALCAYLWPDKKFRSLNDIYSMGGYQSEVFYRLYTSKTPDIRIDARIGRNTYKDGIVTGGSMSASIQYDAEYRRKKTPNYCFTSAHRMVSGDKIQGHPLSSAEAVSVMAQAVDSITHGAPFALANLSMGPGMICDDKLLLTGKEWDGTPYSYIGVFTRTVEGMPLQPLNAQPYRADTNAYVTPVGYERIEVKLDLEGRIASFEWTDPCQVCGEKEACALLPFEQIIAVAERILPLTQADQEKYLGTAHLTIDRIELALLALVQPYDMKVCKLTPVWAFYGQDEA